MSPPPASHAQPDGAGRRKRPRPLPHVNARNLAIEKRRREQMNGNFLDLALLVPSLANAQRLTKVHIVNQAIEHLREQRDLCGAAAREMQELRAENERLAAQVSLLRRPSTGVPPAAAVPVRPVSRTMARLLDVSQVGSGTATLRDAHEGPEPKGKTTALVAVETAIQQQATGLLSSMDHGNDTSAQYCQDLWNPGCDFTGMPEAQQKQLIWSCSVPNAFVDGPSSLLAATGVSTPPCDGLSHNGIASLAYPTNLSLPDTSLYTDMGLHENNAGEIWPGLGIC
ncbi:hypothetical protein LMH87_009569 [Akanthomyces muscarius]|uniref:BHLH domain-containing protein n=1 Tax=Akanthomyces muscarius TaxID=2231603 RepID=A0A9W8QBL7_AKAMU|nr:hypothetical protein LMH87_009569 [Akanthomyces muscarius]KAJ4153063.1 hypothetical protein LMH87_009569 [Akanthomyces muscarius]